MRFIAVCLFVLLPNVFAATTNYFDMDPARFKVAAAQELHIESVNNDLLAAAVLRETNERRLQHRLTALKHSPKASAAARIQSDIMRSRGAISHDNPENARYRTLQLRVKSVGLEYRLIAENVATAFGLQYQSGTRFYPGRQNGRPTFSYRPGGPAIPRHTYATFAKALVDSWMNSKGHRENILRKQAEYLGVHCSPSTDKQTQMPLFYCTQVFFTPMRAGEA